MYSIITDCGGESSQHDELQNATGDTSLDSITMSQDDQQNITTNNCSIEGGDSSLGDQLPPCHVRLDALSCVGVSSTSDDLKGHVEIHVHTVESEFPCDICGKVFSHEHRMNAHRYHHVKRWRKTTWSKNKSKGGPYRKLYPKCNTDLTSALAWSCEQRFSYDDMWMHERQQRSLKRYSCTECDVHYLDIEWLQTKSFDKVHVNRKSCAKLPKSFSNMPQIKKTITGNSVLHSSRKQLVAHGNSIRNPFVFIDCSACCADISITKGLHSGYGHQLFSDSSKCDNSNNNNNNNNSINNTSKVSIDNLSNKIMLYGNVKCSGCGQLFSVNDDLKTHQLCASSAKVNAMAMPALSATVYKGLECFHCGKVFINRSWLNRHNRIHSKV